MNCHTSGLESLDTLLGRRQDDYSGAPLERLGIVLYGAGNLGRSILRRLRSADIWPLAFADDTPAKRGKTIDGLEIFAPEDILPKFGSDIVFVVTILNPALRFLDAKESLHRRTGRTALSVFELGRAFPDALLPYLQYDIPRRVLENSGDIRRAFNVLFDDESRRQFVAHLDFRLTANYEALPALSRRPYFPADLVGQFSDDCTFVDCGAYDGDTVRGFLLHQRDKFGTIHAFEPDRRNYEKLSAYVRSLDGDIASRIHLHNGAVGDRSGEIAFDHTGDMSAAVSAAGVEKVALFALDDIVREDEFDVYVKLDVEGFEREALEGARRLLGTQNPCLAVSAYHRPNDLWEIPLFLHELGVGYRISLRTEGQDGMDLVCYALSARSKPLPA